MAFVNSIRTYSEKKLIGYTREQLFDVVAAVENYYLFVPACRKSDVVQRGTDRIKAKLEIGIPPLLEAYTSNVKLDKPRLITASCIEGHLFKHLETRWRFRLPPKPHSPTELCLLDFHVSFEFKSLLYAKLASTLFDEMVRLNNNKNIEMETICNPIQVNDVGDDDAVANDSLKGATSGDSAGGADEIETMNNHHREDESAIGTTRTSSVDQPLHQNQLDVQKLVVASNHPIDSSNIKIKRCKHGRIIIKDSSRKRPMQQDDIKETNLIQSKRAEQVSSSKEKFDKDVLSAPNQPAVDKVVESDQNPSIVTNATTDCNDKTTNDIVDSPVGSDKVYGPKEKDSNEVKYSNKSKFTPNSADNNNNNNNNNNNSKGHSRRTRSRSKSPPHRNRRRVSQSPSHRKSPKRYRARSPHRRQLSKSPRRRQSSRERASWKISQETSSTRSSSTRRNRSSAKQDHSPPPSSSHRRDRRTPSRNRSSRRRYSESSSNGSRAASPNNFGQHRVDSIRSPDTRRDRYSRSSGINISRDSIFGRSPTRPNDNLDKDLSSSNALKETYTSKQLLPTSGVKSPLAQQSLPTTSNQSSKCPPTKTAQSKPSLEKSPLTEPSLTPTTDNSISSDIYDPEGPIIPISPGDSPPLSPLIKAAKHSNNNNNNNNHNNHNYSQISKNNTLPDPNSEKGNNEDDVPSSAVELNKKEKYLQKLNRQERVVEEIKIALKPHYQKRAITKEQYKDVLRRAVPKICHSKDGEINPVKIRIMVEAYVKKMKKKNRSR